MKKVNKLKRPKPNSRRHTKSKSDPRYPVFSATTPVSNSPPKKSTLRRPWLCVPGASLTPVRHRHSPRLGYFPGTLQTDNEGALSSILSLNKFRQM